MWIGIKYFSKKIFIEQSAVFICVIITWKQSQSINLYHWDTKIWIQTLKSQWAGMVLNYFLVGQPL